MTKRLGLPLFCRLAARTYFPGSTPLARPTPRRLFIMTLFIPGLALLLTLHWIGFALDEVLFRGYRRIAVRDPVFIVGVPRSGTTVLQKALARDPAVTTFAAWELIFAPSIAERKLWSLVGRLDALMGGPAHRLMAAVERRAFRALDTVHPVRLFEPEEDAFVLFPLMASIYLFVPFPFASELWHLARFDTDTPKAQRERIMRFYYRCVQRHLYVHGPDKRFLSKNPTFSPMVESLRSAFPGARVVCCIRTPLAVVPSVTSLLTIPWRAFANATGGNTFQSRVMDLLDHWYRYPLQRLDRWPRDRHAVVTYDALVADPAAAVETLYHRFGFAVDDTFAAALADLRERATRYRSPHHYSLAQFALTSDEIVTRYRDVFARFGMATDTTAAADTPRTAGAEPGA